MTNMRRFAMGALAGILMLFVPAGAAGAAPVKPVAVVKGKVAAVKAARSICDTGFRGNPAYDRKCLTTGTFKTGAMLWLNTPEGRKGRESRDAFNRRSICKYSGTFGGIRPAVREAFNDVAYDHYRNYGAVLTYAGNVAKLDCTAMGYRVK